MSDITENQQALDDELDAQLLSALKDGVKVLNKDGKAVKITAPHQYFEVTRKRLSDLGMNKESQPGDNVHGLIAALAKDPKALETHDIPEFVGPMSDEEDAASA